LNNAKKIQPDEENKTIINAFIEEGRKDYFGAAFVPDLDNLKQFEKGHVKQIISTIYI
jgi:hypothetical protein